MEQTVMSGYEDTLEKFIRPEHSDEWNNAVKTCQSELQRTRLEHQILEEKRHHMTQLMNLIMTIAEDALAQNMFAVSGFDSYAIAYDTMEDRLCIETHSRGYEAFLFSEVEYAQEMVDKYHEPLLDAYRALYYAKLPSIPLNTFRDTRDEGENRLWSKMVFETEYPQLDIFEGELIVSSPS